VYYVTFVRGNVKVASTGKALKISDKINENDKLVFADKDSKISCISPTKGRFDITPHEENYSKQREWVTILKNALVPSSPKRQFSTRGDSLKTNDPKKPFPNNLPDEKVLIPENEWININPAFDLSGNNSYVYLQYSVNGAEVTRVLPSKGQAIQFDKSLFVNRKNEAVSPEKIGKVNMVYRDTSDATAKIKTITRFRPILISVEDFQKQVAVLKMNLEAMKKKPEAINSEIYEHFNTNYGYTNPAIFGKYL
jgi:hypothetical protein